MYSPLIGLCICYGLGILAGTIFDFPLTFLFSILVICFLAAGISLLREVSIHSTVSLRGAMRARALSKVMGRGNDDCSTAGKDTVSPEHLLRRKSILSTIFLYVCVFLLAVLIIHYHREDPLHIRNLVSGGKVGHKTSAQSVNNVGTLGEQDGTFSRNIGRKLALRGTVVSEPGPNRFTLRAEEVFEKGKWCVTRGLVLVKLNWGSINCRYGDNIRIHGYFYIPSPPRNPGQFDYRSYLARKKIHVLANVSSRDSVSVLGLGRVNPLVKFAFILKRRMERIIRKSMSPPQRFFLESVLLGNRYLLPAEWKETFTHTGTAQVFPMQ